MDGAAVNADLQCGTGVWPLGTMPTILGKFQTKYNLPLIYTELPHLENPVYLTRIQKCFVFLCKIELESRLE